LGIEIYGFGNHPQFSGIKKAAFPSGVCSVFNQRNLTKTRSRVEVYRIFAEKPQPILLSSWRLKIRIQLFSDERAFRSSRLRFFRNIFFFRSR